MISCLRLAVLEPSSAQNWRSWATAMELTTSLASPKAMTLPFGWGILMEATTARLWNCQSELNPRPAILVAGDFNRDGKMDFAIPTPGQALGLGVLLNATPRATCTPSTVSLSVMVCQPQNLIHSNPVHWIADSRDTSHPVTAMQTYVDNKLVVNEHDHLQRNTGRNLSRGY
jgi:hypothetical protein